MAVYVVGEAERFELTGTTEILAKSCAEQWAHTSGAFKWLPAIREVRAI